MLTLQMIEEARERIAPYAVKTPLLRLNNLDAALGCEVYVKAECMQNIGAFKLRGAMNRAMTLTKEEIACGLVTASSGNHGRALAFAGKMLGAKVTVVVPNTATPLKKENIRKLGAEIVECDNTERFIVAERIARETGATMVPPFNDEGVMAGQGTIGLEVLEQCPQLDVVVSPVAGGGLLGGLATAIKGVAPEVKVIGAEPSVRARYSESLKAGRPVTVENHPTVADALAALTPGEKCFPSVQKYVDEVVTVDDEYILKGMKLLLTEGKLLAEPSSCIVLGAVLQGKIKVKPTDKVCFVISGGNVAFEQLKMLDDVEI